MSDCPPGCRVNFNILDLNKFGTRVTLQMAHAQSECELAPAWQWGDLSRGQVRLLTTAREVKTLIKKLDLSVVFHT